jgi:hypothetical protein
MKALLFSFVIALTACAHSTGARPVNVHSVRVAIKGRIEAMPGNAGPRAIISMGKVTETSAVVYTESAAHLRLEETWVKGASGWTLQDSHNVATAQ